MHGLPVNTGSHAAIQLASAVVGLSGVGKSEAIERALALMPQVVVHEKLPGLEGPVRQLVWLKLDVPDTGRLKDLVASLFRAADQALGSGYFDLTKSGRQRLGADAAEEWIAKMRCHFLGVLVLDEIQNLFRMLSREMRQVAKRRGQDRLELRVVEDQAVKFILNLTNCTKFPVMVSGTPDGIAALETRMSTASRISTGGLIAFPRADSPDDLYFSKVLRPRLVEYQWLPRAIDMSAELRGRLHRLSGGILRNAIGLWQHGQQRAIMAGAEALCIDDLECAAADVLAMNRGAIDALLSQDPRRMAQYEDLVPYHRS